MSYAIQSSCLLLMYGRTGVLRRIILLSSLRFLLGSPFLWSIADVLVAGSRSRPDLIPSSVVARFTKGTKATPTLLQKEGQAKLEFPDKSIILRCGPI
ncbi:hypothetical protein B0H14DRAFT_3022426 [Mycena olivaceomarginata]|nr:hypothetical protein B0H14DRAFT_3022426 [Mycena olivaceomarginata]